MEQFSKDQKSQKTELGKNLILVFLVLLVLISGTKLYLDHLDSTKQTAEISALTAENQVLSTRLDSVEKQLKIRIQELEKFLGLEFQNIQIVKWTLLKKTLKNSST